MPNSVLACNVKEVSQTKFNTVVLLTNQVYVISSNNASNITMKLKF